jgi:hypothetical protein
VIRRGRHKECIFLARLRFHLPGNCSEKREEELISGFLGWVRGSVRAKEKKARQIKAKSKPNQSNISLDLTKQFDHPNFKYARKLPSVTPSFDLREFVALFPSSAYFAGSSISSSRCKIEKKLRTTVRAKQVPTGFGFGIKKKGN